MRVGYDGITPARLPANGDVYLSYINGQWPNGYSQLSARFPGKVYGAITVNSHTVANVADCEAGDLTPEECPTWVLGCRQWGVDPTVYCNYENTYPDVIQAFRDQRVNEPWYWVACYKDIPSPVGQGRIVVWQKQSTPGYDVNEVADYWPGVDPAPAPHLLGVDMFDVYQNPASPAQEAIFDSGQAIDMDSAEVTAVWLGLAACRSKAVLFLDQNHWDQLHRSVWVHAPAGKGVSDVLKSST